MVEEEEALGTELKADAKKEPAPKEPVPKEPVPKKPEPTQPTTPTPTPTPIKEEETHNVESPVVTVTHPEAAALPGLDEAIPVTNSTSPSVSEMDGNADDVKTWTALSQEAMAEGTEMDRRRELFESILQKFPFSSRHWVGYTTAEQKNGESKRVEALLKRALLTCESVELWEFYIKYVDDKTKAEGKEEQRVEILKRAFEFALQHVGFAMTAQGLWRRYLEVLKAQKADSQYELSQRMTTLRRVYQRAVVVPMHQVDMLWREYERFENELGKNTAQKLLNEYATPHSKALAVYKERKTLWAGLINTTFPERSKGGKDEDLLNRWMKLIAYEESNPEKVSAVLLRVRVRHTYIHALASLQFFPEVWYAFAMYERRMNDISSAITILDRALYALPDSLLLNFTAADFLESIGRTKAAKERYEALLADEKKASPVAYIQFMKFLRRTEGMKPARNVFLKARKSPSVTSAVYIASAWMEVKVNRNFRVARRVFEMGMPRFSKDPTFAQEYLRFVTMTNEQNDLCDLFERLLKSLDTQDALPIWKMYRQFCADVLGEGGDIQALEAVEKRIADAYPDNSTLHGLVGVMHRYSCYSTFYDNASKDDQAFYKRNKHAIEGVPVVTSQAADPGVTVGDDIPEFLRGLMGILPKKIRGTAPDTEIILNKLRNFRMPQRPTASMPANGRKRGIGAVSQADTQDLYALRQKLS